MSNIASMSDKALIYEIRHGNGEALSVLAKRFGFPVHDTGAVVSAIRRMRVTTVNAAKRIIAANAVPT